jgi:gliding motility-associated-like protein
MTIRVLLLLTFFFTLKNSSLAQCANPTVFVSENFNTGPVVGAVTANIYGNGSWNNAAYILSGAGHGWFNVIDGLSNVDVYNRQVTGLCVGAPVNASVWVRHSFGTTNVTISAVNGLGAVLQTTTLNLTTVYQQINFNFVANTSNISYVVRCNSVGGNGVDICMEDLLITQCPIAPSETRNYGVCSQLTPINLFSLFSPAIPAGGTWSGPSALTNASLGTFDPTLNANGTYQYTVVTTCGPGVSTVIVEIMPDVDLGNDTTLCSGALLQLNAGAGFDQYVWSTNATSQSINVVQPGTYSVTVTSTLGNLIVNPGFETAGISFSTDYIPGVGGTWGLLSNAGTYAITTSPVLVHSNFANFADHGTTGPGNMLVVNGSSVPNTDVWCQNVVVTPNTTYQFSTWVASAVNGTNVGILQFYVNGAPIGGNFSPAVTAGIWTQYQNTWNSGALTSVNICIINQNTSGGGNDFCLDDLSFAPICTKTDNIVVTTQTPTQTVTTVAPSCNASSDGEIHVNNTLGTEYSFDGGVTWQIDSFLLIVGAGTYSVCSRTALGCQVCQNITLVDPPVVSLTVSNDTLICENGSAQLNATAIGGTTFDYYWDFTASLSGSQSVSPFVNSSYTVYAQNENGCQSAPQTIDVTLRAPLSGTISIFDTICPGFTSDLSATGAGGIGVPYTFTWSTGDVFTGVGANQITVSPAVSSNYSVTIEDACESTPIVLNTYVHVAPLPIPSFTVLNPNQCEPAQFQLVNTTPNTQFSYWVVDGNQEFFNQNTITTWDLWAGDYDVQLEITSTDGCVNQITFTDVLHVDPIPVANFGHSPNPVLMFNTQVHFDNLSINGATYQWFFEDGVPSTSTATHPDIFFPDGLEGTYDVTLITTSDLGCSDTVTIPLVVLPEVLMYAPNAFTPDGDEFNQLWRIHIVGIDVYDFELLLFNRWGEVVWESRDPEQGWDGTYKGEMCPTGTYTWIVRAKDLLNDGQYTFEGHVNLLK